MLTKGFRNPQLACSILVFSYVIIEYMRNPAFMERDPSTRAKLGAGQGERERESTFFPPENIGASW